MRANESNATAQNNELRDLSYIQKTIAVASDTEYWNATTTKLSTCKCNLEDYERTYRAIDPATLETIAISCNSFAGSTTFVLNHQRDRVLSLNTSRTRQ